MAQLATKHGELLRPRSFPAECRNSPIHVIFWAKKLFVEVMASDDVPGSKELLSVAHGKTGSA